MVLERYYLVEKNNKVYCSKCGKQVLKDTYLFKKHEAECKRKVNWVDEFGVKFEDNLHSYKEEELNVFEFKIENDVLLFIVYQLQLKLSPGFKDKYCGAQWNPVFTAKFKHDSRIVEECGIYNIDVWIKMMIDIKKMKYIGEEPISVISKFFKSIKQVYDYGMWLDLYREKGYHYNNIDIKKIQSLTLNPNASVVEHVIDDEVVLECNTSLYDNPIFLSKDFIYSESDLDYVKLVQLPIINFDLSEISKFTQKYPELMINEYFKSGGKSLFNIVLSSNYNKVVEMAGKAGLGVIADSYEEIKGCLNVHSTNPQGVFGISMKQARALNSLMGVSFLKENGFLDAYKKAMKEQPALVTIDNFNINVLNFIFDVYGSGVNLFSEFNAKEILQCARYLSCIESSSYFYHLYKDYIRVCKMIDEYVCGKFPKNLQEAHDLVMRRYELKFDEIKSLAFSKAISEKRYAFLSSSYKENEEDEIFENNKYEIILPQGPMDLQNESDHLGHCVKTYTDRVINQQTYILFLRKKNEIEKSFATIEVLPDYTLIQLKARSNYHAPIDAQEYVKEWAKFKGVKIKSYDFD